MRYTILSLFAFFTCLLSGQQDAREHIKEMCGCYEVTFQYAETFAPSPDYEYHDRYQTGGLEWITLDEEQEDKLVIQHLLIVNDTMIIKHWRQDWLYENRELLQYQKGLEWSRKKLPASQVAGTWTQKVYQVDDSPRYEGYGPWVEAPGQTYWRSQVDAPLPRREFTKRQDYNVMRRTNEHRLTDDGHVHDLDNAKIIRSKKGDSLLVREKGINYYRQVDEKRCEPAKRWWKKHRPYWKTVREVWAETIDGQDYLTIQKEKDGQKLWQALFALDEKQQQEPLPEKELRRQTDELIQSYLSDQPAPWKEVQVSRD